MRNIFHNCKTKVLTLGQLLGDKLLAEDTVVLVGMVKVLHLIDHLYPLGSMSCHPYHRVLALQGRQVVQGDLVDQRDSRLPGVQN